jgi:hypothetical protein
VIGQIERAQALACTLLPAIRALLLDGGGWGIFNGLVRIAARGRGLRK